MDGTKCRVVTLAWSMAATRRGRVFLRAGIEHMDGSTGEVPPDQLPDRDVECGGGLLEDDVPVRQGEGVLHPLDAVDGAAVFHGHPFGFSGGAGGVDDVGDVAGRHGNIRSAFRIGGEVNPRRGAGDHLQSPGPVL